MANRNFANSRIYSGSVMPVLLDVSIAIGASGAVSSIKGAYIKAVTRLAAGKYQIQFQDNYSGYLIGDAQFVSPAPGSDLAIDSASAALVVGGAYKISILGDATAAQWSAIGVAAGVTPAVGVPFVALVTGSGAVSASRVKAVAAGSGIDKIELLGDTDLTLAPMIPGTGAQGGIVLIQTLQAQIGSATTQGTALQYAPADPASTSFLKMSFLLSNSSVKIGGQ